MSTPLPSYPFALVPLHPMDGPDVDCRIRIDEEAVQFQITMNLAFVDAIVDMGREMEDSLHPVEFEGLRGALLEHFVETNRVRVDGIEVTPVLDAEQPFTFTPADPDLVALFPRYGARSLAKVRLVLDYPLKSAPEEVVMEWGVFPDNETYVDPEGNAPPLEINAQLRANGVDELVVFKQDQPQVHWNGTLVSPGERFLEVPDVLGPKTWDVPFFSLGLASVALVLLIASLAGASKKRSKRLRSAFVALFLAVLLEPFGHSPVPAFGQGDADLPDAEQAVKVFRPLQANIYRAFDYEEESDVYDALARSVEGPLLAELYGEIYTSLVQEEAGGAVSRVRSVELLAAEVDDIRRDENGRPSFAVNATWRIEGVVFHWGHAHVRLNEYQARYGVRRGPDGWRIASSQIMAERRIDAAPILPASVLAAQDQGARDADPEAFGASPQSDETPFFLPEGEDL